MKYKMYYEADYDSIERVMDDTEDRSFQEWDGYDRKGDTEDISLSYDGWGGDMRDPNNWRIIFGDTTEKYLEGRENYSRSVPYWNYYIFLFENGERVLIETQSENILEELKYFLNKYNCQPEVILNDDEAFVI